MMMIIDLQVSLEEAWARLEESGFNLLYSIEENGEQMLFGDLPQGKTHEELIQSHPFILSIAKSPYREIDWDSQWAEHGRGYRDGFLYVQLGENMADVRLKPGPGFGDLSHPTTRLVLGMMKEFVKGKDVLDVGCGSGILSLAALAYGAKKVFGIDIDQAAVDHSILNAELNGMKDQIYFTSSLKDLSKKIGKRPLIALMNMIESEQKVAFASLYKIHSQLEYVITSGILGDDEASYLAGWDHAGWRVVMRDQEEGWAAYVFKAKEDVT